MLDTAVCRLVQSQLCRCSRWWWGVNFSHCSLHVNGKLPRAASTPQLLDPPTQLSAPLVTHHTSSARASGAQQTARLPPLHPFAGRPRPTPRRYVRSPLCVWNSACAWECVSVQVLWMWDNLRCCVTKMSRKKSLKLNREQELPTTQPIPTLNTDSLGHLWGKAEN